MATVFVAQRSSVLIDGHAVEGLQSLAFRVVTEREDIRAVGSSERIDVSFGLRIVHGEIVVKSANYGLDAHLNEQSKFQLVVNLKKDPAADAPKRTLSFDDCFVEGKSFGMDAGGTAVTTYAFSATRVREE
jgi:translation elongation factor EF-1beta